MFLFSSIEQILISIDFIMTFKNPMMITLHFFHSNCKLLWINKVIREPFKLIKPIKNVVHENTLRHPF